MYREVFAVGGLIGFAGFASLLFLNLDRDLKYFGCRFVFEDTFVFQNERPNP